MIETTNIEIAQLMDEFEKNGIPTKNSYYLQSYDGKQFIDLNDHVLGDKACIARMIMKKVFWPQKKRSQNQVE